MCFHKWNNKNKKLKCMYMKNDTCLKFSSVDAILVVFADLFAKKANKRKTFPCAVAWNITSCEFRGSTTRLGEEANQNRVFQFVMDGLSRSASIYRLARCLKPFLVYARPLGFKTSIRNRKILSGSDVFVNLPTGYGKPLICMAPLVSGDWAFKAVQPFSKRSVVICKIYLK